MDNLSVQAIYSYPLSSMNFTMYYFSMMPLNN